MEINVRADLDLYVEFNRPECLPPPRAQYVTYDGNLVKSVNMLTEKIFEKMKTKPLKERINNTATSPRSPTSQNRNTNIHATSPILLQYSLAASPRWDSRLQRNVSVAVLPQIKQGPEQLVALHPYDAAEENEISFAEGDIIYLIGKKDDSAGGEEELQRAPKDSFLVTM